MSSPHAPRSSRARSLASPTSPFDAHELREDRAVTTTDALLASVAHELNNPITYVIGNLDDLARLASAMRETIGSYRNLVRRSGIPDAARVIGSVESKIEAEGGLPLIDELIADALEGAHRIRSLARDLSTIHRPREMELGPVDVHEVLESTIRLVARRLTAIVDLERDYRATGLVAADRDRLAQVFLNLVQNAMDACTHIAEDTMRPRIVVRTTDAEGSTRIEITDTGCGIPASVQSRIFDLFYTTKPKGMGAGLGLSLSRHIIDAMGGSISFECPATGGSTFRVELPHRNRR